MAESRAAFRWTPLKPTTAWTWTRLALVLVAGSVSLTGAMVQRGSASVPAHAHEYCGRPATGSAVIEPVDLRSIDGTLTVDLAMRDDRAPDGSIRYCYVTPDGAQAPTLRVHPGDAVVLRLRNRLDGLALLSDKTSARDASLCRAKPRAAADPCGSAAMTALSTNLHFHGMTVAPLCHQDDVLMTSIQPSDAPFEYRFRVPADEAPGLYWYHPHIHGFSSRQVQGGASGALIVEGIERANAEVAGLPERVLIVRDTNLAHPDAPATPGGGAAAVILDRDGDVANNGTGAGKPARDLSVNFVPVSYPSYDTATIAMKPGERQLWRLLNASSVTYLQIAALYQRGPKFRPQWLGVVGIDGVPITVGGAHSHAIEWRDSVMVPPGARVEFIMVGPAAGVPGLLVTRAIDTGPGGENDPNRPLVRIEARADAPEPASTVPALTTPLPAPARAWLGDVAPTRVRHLYFSEDDADPHDPNKPVNFYITVDGEKPKLFDPASTTPAIVATQGDVEDWVIENRTNELHAFHIHQLHFQVLQWMGLPVNEPFLRDTVSVPFYAGAAQPYPSVRVRMDFRDPNTIGTFLFHCHLLDHEDAGMMGLIRVDAPEAGLLSSAGHHRFVGSLGPVAAQLRSIR